MQQAWMAPLREPSVWYIVLALDVIEHGMQKTCCSHSPHTSKDLSPPSVAGRVGMCE